jgi:hypothetical protein
MVKRKPTGLVLYPKVLELPFICYIVTNEQRRVKFRIRFCNRSTFF